MMVRRDNYFYLGIFFMIIQILGIIRNLSTGYLSFFWYCDFTPGIFSILFFLKNDQAIKGLLNIGLFGQLAYAFILIYKLIFGVALFGFIFNFSGFFDIFATLILHFSTLFVLLATYKIRPKEISLRYSFVFLILIYAAVLLFTVSDTSISGNYNFIYYSKTVSPYLQYYTQLWVLLAFTIVVLPTYLFQILIYNLFRKTKSLN